MENSGVQLSKIFLTEWKSVGRRAHEITLLNLKGRGTVCQCVCVRGGEEVEGDRAGEMTSFQALNLFQSNTHYILGFFLFKKKKFDTTCGSERLYQAIPFLESRVKAEENVNYAGSKKPAFMKGEEGNDGLNTMPFSPTKFSCFHLFLTPHQQTYRFLGLHWLK